MNQFKAPNNEILVKKTPLFESTWLALFKGLQKSYSERRLVNPVDTENSTAIKKTHPDYPESG